MENIMEDSTTEARKRAAVQFLRLIVAGHIDEAYQTYVDMKGKHHNPFFPAGLAALQQAMKDNHSQRPNKQINVKNVLADGDLVAVQSELTLSPGGDRMAVWHLHRFEGERIVELWDCGQALPANSPNKDGAF